MIAVTVGQMPLTDNPGPMVWATLVRGHRAAGRVRNYATIIPARVPWIKTHLLAVEFPCSQLGGHAPASSGVSGTAFALAFAGFALDVAGGAVLLLGFHIADEIVRRASLLAHGGVLI